MSKKQQKQKVVEKEKEQETEESEPQKESVLKPIQVEYCPSNLLVMQSVLYLLNIVISGESIKNVLIGEKSIDLSWYLNKEKSRKD